jgi:hypothetical protein
MTQKWLFLTFLISLFCQAIGSELCESVGSEKLTNALQLSAMKCQTKLEKGCQYQECLGKVAGYSKNVLVILPKTVSSLRVHFHGHKLYKYLEYDKNLTSMVKAYGIAPDICLSQEAVIFPESSGKCEDFDRELKTPSQISGFLTGLHTATGNLLKANPLHLSAHSGGGRTVGRMLDAGIKTTEVTIFDGIYSQAQNKQLIDWYQKTQGQLNLYSVRGMSPHNYASALVKQLKLSPKSSETIIKNVPYQQIEAERLVILNRDNNGEEALKAHYSILSQTWGYQSR